MNAALAIHLITVSGIAATDYVTHGIRGFDFSDTLASLLAVNTRSR